MLDGDAVSHGYETCFADIKHDHRAQSSQSHKYGILIQKIKFGLSVLS